MANDPIPDDDLIVRYLASELPGEESDVVRQYLTTHPGSAGIVAGVRASLQGTHLLAHDRSMREIQGERLLRLEEAMASARVDREQAPQSPRRTTWRRASTPQRPQNWRSFRSATRSVWGVGAAVIVGFGALLATKLGHRGTSIEGASPAHVYATGPGQQTTVELSDGTQVSLAPRSRLTVQGRELRLTGLAFFSVIHRGDDAFTVHTGSVTTQVLGTRFTLWYDPRTPETRVSVLDGKVVSGGHRRTILSAGSSARVTDSTVVTSPHSDPALETRWTNGRLVFQNTPVVDVLAMVEQWYGVTFQLADSTVATQHLTATIDTRRSRDAVLTLLSSALDVRMRANGDTIVVTPASRAEAPSRFRRNNAIPLTSHSEVGR